MDERVGHHLAHDNIAHADAHISLQIKRIGKVLCAEFPQPIIGDYEIVPHGRAIVVAVGIVLAEHGVGLIGGARRQHGLRLAKQQRGSAIKSLGPRLDIPHIELGTSQQLEIVHLSPRVSRSAKNRTLTALFDEGEFQILHTQMGKDVLLGENGVLPQVERGYLGIRFQDHVGIGHAIVHPSLEPENSLSRRHPHSKYRAVIVFDGLEFQARRHVEKVGIVGAVDQVALYLEQVCRRNPRHFPVVGHAEEEAPSIPVRKGADGLERIGARVGPAAFEFHRRRFPLAKNGLEYLALHNAPFARFLAE